MNAPWQRINFCERVVNAFGYWPRFHDSEIRSYSLARDTLLFGEIAEVRLELCIHAFEWTDRTPPAFNHQLVRLLFRDVDDVSLDGFNHQNAILELKIETKGESQQNPAGIMVTIVPAHGLSGSFSAAGCEVISVVPCNECGQQIARPNPLSPAGHGPL